MMTLISLLKKEGVEREEYLASLGPWSPAIPAFESEAEIDLIFKSTLKELSKTLGEPVYSGSMLKNSSNLPTPQAYFDATDSALQLAWWECYGGEVALFHTGHDSDSLQFVILAISDSCTSGVA
jgi:hypothetical protein